MWFFFSLKAIKNNIGVFYIMQLVNDIGKYIKVMRKAATWATHLEQAWTRDPHL
jgi:hypothetical protein